MTEEKILLAQARDARVRQSLFKPNTPIDSSGIVIGHKADYHLDEVQLWDGSIRYAQSLTNGAVALQEEGGIHQDMDSISSLDAPAHIKAKRPTTLKRSVATKKYLGFLLVENKFQPYDLALVDIASGTGAVKSKKILGNTGLVTNTYNAIVYLSHLNKVYYFWLERLHLDDPFTNSYDSANLKGKCLVVDLSTRSYQIEEWVLLTRNPDELKEQSLRLFLDYNGYNYAPVYYLGLKTIIVKYLTHGGELRLAAFSGTSDNYANLGGIFCWDLGTLEQSRLPRNNPAFFFNMPGSFGLSRYEGLPFFNAYGAIGGVVLVHEAGRSFASETQITGQNITVYQSLPELPKNLQIMDTRARHFPKNIRPSKEFLLPLALIQDRGQVNYDYEINP